jgi:hypothetical protein
MKKLVEAKNDFSDFRDFLQTAMMHYRICLNSHYFIDATATIQLIISRFHKEKIDYQPLLESDWVNLLI